jgi:hypothetical protein
MTRWGHVVPLLLLVVLGACDGDSGAEPADPAPRPGARAPVPSTPPARPMDALEQPVADRLAPELRDEGLSLEYVDCPAWPGEVPFETECTGYVDGVAGEVEVVLSHGHGGAVEFDARLAEGVVATSRLVDRLEREGWTGVDCGSTSAYPARLGLRIVCRVHEGGTASYVVATVTDRRGEVEIEDH